MTARCQLCGVTVTSRYIAQDATEIQLLMEYDNLSAHMWNHVHENHRHQADEGKNAAQRTLRMYAMNWADHTETMIHIKQEWRKHMLIALTITSRSEQDTPGRHPNCSCGTGSRGACIVHSKPPDHHAADAAAADPAAGSNAKNSDKNRSN